jgi:hypothetical protein
VCCYVTKFLILCANFSTEVNAGAIEICKEFLGHAGKYKIQQVQILIDYLAQFLKHCADGLALNKNLIGPDQAFFHAQLEQGYAEIKTEIYKYIEIALTTDWSQVEVRT